MLNSIRKAADSLIFRIILGIIVIAFGFWGIDDVLRSRNNFDLVTFKNARNISQQEFAKAKAREISIVQRNQGIHLSDEQIKELQINERVLDRLISNRLVELLINRYSLDLGEKTLADFIKQQDGFKNKEGKFDIEIFKAALRHSGMSEEEYAIDIKSRLIHSLLLGSFIRASYVPDAAVNNIAEFMSEERICDLATIDLTSSKYRSPRDPSADELQEFYKANAELFTLPERRNISYVIIGEDFVGKDIKISELDAKKFFDENKEEFGNKTTFAKSRPQIEAMLKSKAAEELLIEFAKNLEDEVAAGTSLKEIAANLKLQITDLSSVSLKDLTSNKNIGKLSDNIFGMHEGEVSYPLEMTDSKAIALVEVTNIEGAQVQDLQKIKPAVTQKWKLSEIRNSNIKAAQDFAATTTFEDFKKDAIKLGFNIKADTKLKRAELGSIDKLPPAMLTALFSNNAGSVSQVYLSGDNAFVATILQIKRNPDIKKAIIKESGENITQQIKNGLVQEIIGYIKNKENTQINQHDRVLE